MANADKNFFNQIIMGDELGVLPMTLKQSNRVLNGLVKFQKSCIKTILIILFNSQGIVHKEFIPEGKTVNVEFYKGVMNRPQKRIQQVHPAVFCS
jgi:hypothetical protein